MYEWDDKYCIGESHIDSQHQKLFQICKRIMKIWRKTTKRRAKEP